MKRSSVLLFGTLTFVAALPIVQGLAQTQAPAAPPAGAPQDPAAGRGRGRGPQTPPPPPLTCTSKATDTDNKVPAALAKDGFTAIFNGKDLTGWQALIDIGTLKFGAGLNPADLEKLSKAEKAAKQKESNDTYLKHWSVVDGILVFDGVQADKLTPHVEKGGQNLQTVKEYGDVDLYVGLASRSGQRRLPEERAADSMVEPAWFRRPFQQQGGRQEPTRCRRQSSRPLEHVPHHPAQQRHDDGVAERSTCCG